MSDIADIPTDEMVEDYYASKMDADTCERIGILERAEVNRKIMAKIRTELERRGELGRLEE